MDIAVYCSGHIRSPHASLQQVYGIFTQGHKEPGAFHRKHQAQGGVHPGQGASPSQGTITYTLTHSFIHYGQFIHANQPTMHVFGLGEETEVPGGNPGSTGRTCKLRTHMANVLTTKPPCAHCLKPFQ
ncbi:hypothetical protein AMELA_G00230800 [Ameiurus melas]|uniref:Uncharacterized protein n=1 Tax=Ameiurus melas TaxID=219545 RepID=A0A7J5ZXF4_AMEME|nr:hypothetical protein AMELA_G00230800 [Ameiurus melas]